MHCPSCDLRFKSSEVFCANCGARLQPIVEPVKPVAPPRTSVARKTSDPALKMKVPSTPTVASPTVSLKPSAEKKKLTSFEKRIRVLSGVVAIALVFGGIKTAINAGEKRSILPSETVQQAFSAEMISKHLPPCSTLDQVINDDIFTKAIEVSKKSSKIKNANSAISFDKTNSIPTEYIATTLESQIRELTEESLETMFAESGRDEKAKSPQIVGWKAQWFDLSLTSCNLYNQFYEVKDQLEQADQEFTRLRYLIAMGPEEGSDSKAFAQPDSKLSPTPEQATPVVIEYPCRDEWQSWPCYCQTISPGSVGYSITEPHCAMAITDGVESWEEHCRVRDHYYNPVSRHCELA